MTYEEIIKKYNLTLKLNRVPFRTDSTENTWDAEATHYVYSIENNKGAVRGFYSQGSAIKTRPSLVDILNSLNTDTLNIDNSSPEDWLSDFGYDTDSIKATRIYKACFDEYLQLIKVLGRDGFRELGECESL